MTNRPFHTWAVADPADAGSRVEVASDGSLDEGAIIRTISESSILSSGVEYFLGVDYDETNALVVTLQHMLADEHDDDDELAATLDSLLVRLQKIQGYRESEAAAAANHGSVPLSRDEALAAAGVTGPGEWLVLRFNVDGFTDREKTALHIAAVVQGEGSDGNGDATFAYPSSDPILATWEGTDAPGAEDRAVLVHYHVSVAADDPRSAEQIAEALTAAMNVGLEGAPEEIQADSLSVTMALADEV